LNQHGDEVQYLSLPRRKFDHDLRKTMNGLDVVLSGTGLKYYRERVWPSASPTEASGAWSAITIDDTFSMRSSAPTAPAPYRDRRVDP